MNTDLNALALSRVSGVGSGSMQASPWGNIGWMGSIQTSILAQFDGVLGARGAVD